MSPLTSGEGHCEEANLLDDVDALLGRLAECFGDDETEFADIKLMRARVAAVDIERTDALECGCVGGHEPDCRARPGTGDQS